MFETATTQSFLKKAFTYYLIFQVIVWVVGAIVVSSILVMRHFEAAKNASAVAAATAPVMSVNGVQHVVQAVAQTVGRKQLLAEYCPAPYTTNQRKSKLVTFLLGFFVGNFGADRFYLGDIGAGIGKLITSGGFGIWTLIDWCLVVSDQLYDSTGCPLKLDM